MRKRLWLLFIGLLILVGVNAPNQGFDGEKISFAITIILFFIPLIDEEYEFLYIVIGIISTILTAIVLIWLKNDFILFVVGPFMMMFFGPMAGVIIDLWQE
jgi:hypothetical protein